MARSAQGAFRDFVKVDFHVHTPASDDYVINTGSRETEYRTWLEKCLESDTGIIMITDHNSFSGYFQICDIIDEYTKKLKHLTEFRSQFAFAPEQEAEYERLSRKVSALNELWFIPGVEVEPYEGIHLLVMFPTETKSEVLVSFLRQLGIRVEDEGASIQAGRNTSLDVIDLARQLGGIVVAAHIDSDKGLYNVVPKGSTRVQILTQEGLYGLQYGNQVNADKLRSAMRGAEYQRASKVSFVKGSDFHNRPGEQIGEPATYLQVHKDQLARKDFQAIRNALRNPDECVSPAARPEVQEILNNMISDPKVLRVERADTPEAQVQLARAMAALVNSAPEDLGRLLVGVTSMGNKVGVRTTPEQFQEQFEAAIDRMEYAGDYYSSDIGLTLYKFADTHIASVNVYRRPGALCSVDGRIYVLKDGKPSEATPSQIKRMVEVELDQKYRLLSVAQEKRIAHAIELLQNMADTLQVIKVARKLETRSIRATVAFAGKVMKMPARYFGLDPKLEPENGVGPDNADLGVVINAAPRQAGAYWRFLLPMYGNGADYEGLPKVSAGTVLLSGQGACYWAPKDMGILPLGECLSLTVPPELGPEVTTKTALAFMKSSLCLWYLQSHYGSCDFLDLERFGNLPIPLIPQGTVGEVEALVDEVIRLEVEFLAAGDQVQAKDVQEHNTKIATLIIQLDALFFRLVDLSQDEITLVYDALETEGVWIPTNESEAVADEHPLLLEDEEEDPVH